MSSAIAAKGCVVFACGIGLWACANSPHEGAADCLVERSADERWFVDVSAARGLSFVHRRLSESCASLDSVDGPGVCAFDADADGDSDLFFPNRAGAQSALFRNDDGSFSDVAAEVGLASTGDSLGCLPFDFDQDGDLDLYVTNVGPDLLLRNDQGVFVDVSLAAGIVESGYSTTASAGDVDGDGDLDLFVARLADLTSCADPCTDLPINCERMETNLLLMNDGGVFREESVARGIVEREPSLVSALFDVDADGDLDIYVGNDKGYEFPDRLYLNEGAGFFQEVAPAWGLDAPGSDTMGVALADLDLDGFQDFVVTDYSGRPTVVFVCGAELPCQERPLSAESTSFVNWAVLLRDLDLDGDLDLFQTSGAVLRPDERPAVNQLFLNDGAGRLSYHSPAEPSALARTGPYRSAASLDFDQDGDQDLVVTMNGGPAVLLENVAGAGNSVTVEVGGLSPGTFVTATTGTLARREQVWLGNGYLGASEPTLTFGLGSACSATIELEGQELTAVAGDRLRISPGGALERAD